MAKQATCDTPARRLPFVRPEGSEVVDDGRSRNSSSEDALSRTPTQPRGSHDRQPPGEQIVASIDAAGPLVEAIAARVAELLAAKPAEPASPWLTFEQACAHLGFTPNTLYKLTAAGAIPCRKKAGGQGLRFHRDELDEWMRTAYPRVDRLA